MQDGFTQPRDSLCIPKIIAMQRTPRVAAAVVCAVCSVTSADVCGQRNICSARCEGGPGGAC